MITVYMHALKCKMDSLIAYSLVNNILTTMQNPPPTGTSIHPRAVLSMQPYLDIEFSNYSHLIKWHAVGKYLRSDTLTISDII